MKKIGWWQTEFSTGEAEAAAKAITEGRVSQGALVAEFEIKLASYLGVKHVVATTSGSDAILLALWASNIRPFDEVLIPNRTWIATAHAALLLGAIPVIVDTDNDKPTISLADLERKISDKTKVVIPVHMNGRNAHIDEVLELGEKYKVKVIEDAAQALGSRDRSGTFLGTKSLAGCFSLSVAKVISSGQGGFIASNDDEFALRLRHMRTHGVENAVEPKTWSRPGFNFRFTDILASVGLAQLAKLDSRLSRLRDIYQRYVDGLATVNGLEMIQIDVLRGEIGPYIEILCKDREKLANHLKSFGIETRVFYPDLVEASYLSQGARNVCKSIFGLNGIYFPSGPLLSDGEIDFVLAKVRSYYE